MNAILAVIDTIKSIPSLYASLRAHRQWRARHPKEQRIVQTKVNRKRHPAALYPVVK